MEGKGSSETKRTGERQIFLTALLQILASFHGVCWLEHDQVQQGSAVGEGTTGRRTWSSQVACSADFKVVDGAGVISGARVVYTT